MGKKSQEQYVSEVLNIHCGKYSYSKTIYEGSQKHIVVTCPVHSDFSILAVEHTRGKGCQKCSTQRRADSHKHTFEDFVEISTKKHGGKYYYTKPEVYEGEWTLIEMTCGEHPPFSKSAVEHKMGRGCVKCAHELVSLKMRHTKDEFVTLAKNTHGEKYDYSKVDYEDSLQNVEIVCNEHGPFWQTPANHKQGRGCPECAWTGFDSTKAAYLYILESYNLVKVGITNRTPEHRAKQISKASGDNFKVCFGVQFKSGLDALKIEGICLKWLRSRYPQPEIKFDGSTECFHKVSSEELLKFILTQIRGPND